jgi:hypothetical protein
LDEVSFEDSRQLQKEHLVTNLPTAFITFGVRISYRYFQFCSADNLSSVCADEYF